MLRSAGVIAIAVLTALGCRSAAAPASAPEERAEPTSRQGLSADVQAAAAALRQFIGEKLAQAPDEATHDARVAEARGQLAALRAKTKTEADRKVTVLLALLMVKDNERKRLVFQTRQGLSYELVQDEIAALYEAREQCNTEVLGWLGQTVVESAQLAAGPCLAEAQQAAAVLEQ